MGDRIDSIFQRQCSLTEFDDPDRSGGQETKVTILEIGGQRPVDTHHCSGYHELRNYFDLQNHSHHEVDLFLDEPQVSRPRSLKLFFFPFRGDNRDHSSTFSKAPPAITDLLNEQTGLSLDFPVDDVPLIDDDHEDEPLSPTSSPRLSPLVTRSRNPRFPLDTVGENEPMMLQSRRDETRRTWTWETRYTHSSTRTLADQHTTTYFCMNFPAKLRQRISDTIHSLDALAKNPLFMDTLIIDEMIAFYRDAIKSHRSELLALNDDESTGTEMSIKLEELATHWRTILRDIHNIQTHIHQLRELAESRTSRERGRTPSPISRRGDYHRHTRQKSSDVFGPPATEILQLQNSTCEFWARCVNMYLERTTDRIRNSTYRLRKTIPLRRRGSLPQLNRRLSNFTIEVAVQFQRNSSSVSTLALSFFSTIFFSPDGLLFAITYWWWIVATLIVPLTFIIIHLWFETLASNTAFLRRRKVHQQQQQQQQQLDGVEEEEMD